MFTFGFSYVGLLYLCMLWIPNLIRLKNQRDGDTSEGENKVLMIFEKIGEGLCTGCAIIFADFNIRNTEWLVWLGLSFLLMILYEIYWLRNFRSEKKSEDFYRPMFGIKVPGATLPVAAFFLLGIYGTNVFMMISSVIFGIGHIGIHMQHYRKYNPEKTKFAVKLIKGILAVPVCLLFLILLFFIGARNFNYRDHYRLIENGVDEGLFVDLGGQQQYVLIRGVQKSNPMIVFLHGGPSSPESYVNYCWVDDIVNEYTVVDWDQRGCGRTYEYNKNTDPQNETATFEQALTDLDNLVDYACERFGQEQVIIVGHSYGTVLGACYIERHPEKVSRYVSIAQVISMDINNRTMAEDALDIAAAKGDDVTLLKERYEAYLANPGVSTTLSLRQEAFRFLPEALPENSTWVALTSPYMGMGDFKWFLKQLAPVEEYLARNKQLYDILMNFDLYQVAIPEKFPVYFISGTLDYACPVATIEDYLESSDIDGSFDTLEGCGHNVQYTKPHEVSKIILEVLSGE